MLAKIFKPMDYSQFKKEVTKAGWRIEPTAKHHSIVDENNETVMVFAVHHTSGTKRYVKPYYIHLFKEHLKAKGI
ncbi:MAG: hypothetical protein NTW61_00155 [Candidatus Melainabacteria bacterium]|jgi:hypothetical protein|nr:hypothetical protein [Candidatus Melainabacteria bacterium]